MPGYVIHLAVAKEYLRNFRVSNETDFLKGVIAPDLLSKENKKETHYSEKGGAETDLNRFIKEKKINTSYMEGYFLHLIVDYLFYNEYFTNYDKRLYDDYDILNAELIEKYKIEVPEEVKEQVHFKSGELQILEKEKLYKMITEISNKKIRDYKKELKKTGTVTTQTEDIKIATLAENRKDKVKLGVLIILLCAVMLFFINQKEGFHCDEIFSYGSSNSAYENIFWSYRDKTPMHKFLEQKIFQDGNILDWTKRIKYYFIDNVEEKDQFITEKMYEEKMIWRTREEAKDYMDAQENTFNYASVYYNQVQDVHPPLFYFLVHTVSSIFSNTFSKYIIFFISLPFFIGTCILIWKILNLIRKKIYFNINSCIIWIKHRCYINNDVSKNVYDAYFLYNSVFVYKYINTKK